jgi:hypothetical protein
MCSHFHSPMSARCTLSDGLIRTCSASCPSSSAHLSARLVLNASLFRSLRPVGKVAGAPNLSGVDRHYEDHDVNRGYTGVRTCACMHLTMPVPAPAPQSTCIGDFSAKIENGT